MPRPTIEEAKKRRVEKRKMKNEKIRQTMRKNGANTSEEFQDRILKAMGDSIKTYTELKNASNKQGLKGRTFRINFKRLKEKEEIVAVKVEGKKRFSYMKAKIQPCEALEFFAIKMLAKSLREGDTPADFNQHLGSLITYTLRHHSEVEAKHIIETVLSEVQGYIKPPKPENDQRLLICGVPAVTYNLESPQWAVWKAVDSRSYITTIQVQGQEQIVNREAFNYPKFEKDWLSV